MITRYIDNTKLEKAFGLQAGELYEAGEECHTHITQHTYKGKAFEVWLDEMAGPLSQWKAFAMGIGTKSGLVREEVINRIKQAIDLKG